MKKRFILLLIFSSFLNTYSQIVKIDSTIRDIVSLNTENSLFYGSTKFSIEDFIITDTNIIVLVPEKKAIYFLNKKSKLIEDTIDLDKNKKIKFRSSYNSKLKSPIFSYKGNMGFMSEDNIFIGIVANNKSAYSLNITNYNNIELKDFNLDSLFKNQVKQNFDTIYRDKNYKKFSSIISSLKTIHTIGDYNIYTFRTCPLLNYDKYINKRGMHPLEFGEFSIDYPTIYFSNKENNKIEGFVESSSGVSVEIFNDRLIIYDNRNASLRIYSDKLKLISEVFFNNFESTFLSLKKDVKQNKLFLVGMNRKQITSIYQVKFEENVLIELVTRVKSNFKFSIKQIYDDEFYFLIPNEANLYIYKNSLMCFNSDTVKLNSSFYNEKISYIKSFNSDISNILVNFQEDYILPKKKDIKKHEIKYDINYSAKSVNELFSKTLDCIRNDNLIDFFSFLAAYTEDNYDFFSSSEMNNFIPKNIDDEIKYFETLKEMYTNKEFYKKDNYLLFYKDNLLSVIVEINKKWYFSIARLEYLITN